MGNPCKFDFHQIADVTTVVKTGSQPDEPEHLTTFVTLWREYAELHPQTRVFSYLRCADILLQVSRDQKLPLHWRQQCANAIHKPFYLACRFATSSYQLTQVRAFQARLSLTN
ncbi:hypothetical protein [Alteromonas confluentis]|uniref:hypothetical protein n=1 Tax=Alteromonas confluentis TaxID=1656094 RepID=UPI00147CEC54|nr:hypothetical protein [Alteromonas confluentis]